MKHSLRGNMKNSQQKKQIHLIQRIKFEVGTKMKISARQLKTKLRMLKSSRHAPWRSAGARQSEVAEITLRKKRDRSSDIRSLKALDKCEEKWEKFYFSDKIPIHKTLKNTHAPLEIVKLSS